MPHQVALTLGAQVRPGEVERLKRLLEEMGDGVANGSVVDLSSLEGIHFARFVLVEGSTGLAGERLQPMLVYMSDLDVSRERHLADLVDRAGDGIDRLFGLCEGYPEAAHRTRDGRFAFLSQHRLKEQAFYVNTVGRTRKQIRQEAELRERLESFLDDADDLR
ncbi:MAG: hypothetical protein M3P18_06665, partial [Actinomycetota bacterium]|nr:hypothetical protein [Actinomycetota bacterium]